MTPQEVQLYARFSHAMRRAGTTVDLMRFVNDSAYAELIVQQALLSGDVELLQLALHVGDARKLLNGSRVNATSAKPRDDQITVKPTARPEPPTGDIDNGPPTGSKSYKRTLR